MMDINVDIYATAVSLAGSLLAQEIGAKLFKASRYGECTLNNEPIATPCLFTKQAHFDYTMKKAEGRASMGRTYKATAIRTASPMLSGGAFLSQLFASDKQYYSARVAAFSFDSFSIRTADATIAIVSLR